MQTEGKFQAGAFLRNEGAMALFKGIQVRWLPSHHHTITHDCMTAWPRDENLSSLFHLAHA